MGMRYTTTPTSRYKPPKIPPQKNKKQPHTRAPPHRFFLSNPAGPKGIFGDALVVLLARRGDPRGDFWGRFGVSFGVRFLQQRPAGRGEINREQRGAWQPPLGAFSAPDPQILGSWCSFLGFFRVF